MSRCVIRGSHTRQHIGVMNMKNISRTFASLAVIAFLGSLILTVAHRPLNAQNQAAPGQAAAPAAPAAAQERQPTKPNPATVPEDVAHLKDLVPPSSHPMVDVSFNASMLWFAAEKKNWALANYMLGETRNRLQWEVRLNPGPKSATGEIVDMKGTVDGIANGSMAELKKAIDGKDVTAFEASYKHLLEDCYSCHKNTNRAYMRPQIPTAPPTTIINFDPTATWPQ